MVGLGACSSRNILESRASEIAGNASDFNDHREIVYNFCLTE